MVKKTELHEVVQHCCLCKKKLTPFTGYKIHSKNKYGPYCRECNTLVQYARTMDMKDDTDLKMYLRALQFRVTWTIELMKRRGIL